MSLSDPTFFTVPSHSSAAPSPPPGSTSTPLTTKSSTASLNNHNNSANMASVNNTPVDHDPVSINDSEPSPSAPVAAHYSDSISSPSHAESATSLPAHDSNSNSISYEQAHLSQSSAQYIPDDMNDIQARMANNLSFGESPVSQGYSSTMVAQPPPVIHAPHPRPFAQAPGSRSASPGFRPPQASYMGGHSANNSLSDLAPPHPGFSMGSSAVRGNSIVRSSSTPNVLQSQHTGGSQSPYMSPMLHPQRNASGTRLSKIARPFSTMSSASSTDMGSGPGSGHATDFYSYTNKEARNSGIHGRSHSMAFTELPGASAFDLSQSFLNSNLGANSSNLVPRMKTIELYRKNARKSNDPVIQFQFAQYMLQTALLANSAPSMLDSNGRSPSMGLLDDDDFELEFPTIPAARGHSRVPSNASNLSLAQAAAGGEVPQASLPSPSLGPLTAQDERKIKRALLKEAVANLRRLADKGYADAQYLLGDAYASGALGKADLKESFSLFQLAAKHGHAEASYRTALCLEEGWGTSKDARRAVQFLRQSASRNHPGAMLRLGVAQFYGKLGLHVGASTSNKVKTQQDGIKWLTRAADAANEIFPQGPYELAKIYEDGYRDLVFKDLQYAVQLYVKSADLNYVPAASKLGHAYEYGELGCPQDAALSIHYYTIAALGGDPKAMLAMCAWYMVGAEPMLPRNAEEAYEWATRAAERGLAKAQYATGYFLENGIGTERDILQASRWYHMAASGGDERAIERIKNNRVLASKPQIKHKQKSIVNLRSLALGGDTRSIAPSVHDSVQGQHVDTNSISGGSLQVPMRVVADSASISGGSIANGSIANGSIANGSIANEGQVNNLDNENLEYNINQINHEIDSQENPQGLLQNDNAPPGKSKKGDKDKDCIIM